MRGRLYHLEIERDLADRLDRYRKEVGCTSNGFIRLAIRDRLRTVAPTEEEKQQGVLDAAVRTLAAFGCGSEG